jgi:hypothetical protein
MLHWRVWAPLAYLIDPDGEEGDAIHQRATSMPWTALHFSRMIIPCYQFPTSSKAEVEAWASNDYNRCHWAQGLADVLTAWMIREFNAQEEIWAEKALENWISASFYYSTFSNFSYRARGLHFFGVYFAYLIPSV